MARRCYSAQVSQQNLPHPSLFIPRDVHAIFFLTLPETGTIRNTEIELKTRLAVASPSGHAKWLSVFKNNDLQPNMYGAMVCFGLTSFQARERGPAK
jgi:hypothetical protein